MTRSSHTLTTAVASPEAGDADTDFADRLSRFELGLSGVRGVLVRLSASWRSIRSQGGYPPAVAALLGETTAASALFTGHSKIDGQLSIQLRGSGALRTLFAECASSGRLRGIARYQEPIPETLGPRDFGTGSILAITIESTPPGGHEANRYQGLVGLNAETLAQAFEDYFAQSEQLPTRIALAADARLAVGLMLQRLPGTDRDPDGWNRANRLFDTMSRQELLQLPSATLLHRLFHQDGAYLLDQRPLHFGCTCSQERVAAVLRQIGHDEALAAIQADGRAEITCEFCHRVYHFDRIDLEALFHPTLSQTPDGPESLQ